MRLFPQCVNIHLFVLEQIENNWSDKIKIAFTETFKKTELNIIYLNKRVQGTSFEIQHIHIWHNTWFKKEWKQFLEKADQHNIIM